MVGVKIAGFLWLKSLKLVASPIGASTNNVISTTVDPGFLHEVFSVSMDRLYLYPIILVSSALRDIKCMRDDEQGEVD
jgi:hypothetical protein